MTWISLLLFGAEVLFLWMFLSAEPLELLADGNAVYRDVAYLFAARWRHGMTNGWLLYMPGFFAVASTVWLWALNRSVRRMIQEGVALLLLALLPALLLQPFGTGLITREFEQHTGLVVQDQPPHNSALGIVRSIYTLLTFAVGIISIQRAIALRRLYPLLLPFFMNFVLAAIRPWTVSDFTSYWLLQVVNRDVVASMSLTLALIAAVAMFYAQRFTSSRSHGELFEAWVPNKRHKPGTDMS